MGYKQGQSREQLVLFPEALEDYISEENAVRVIDVYVESLNLLELGFSKSMPSDVGRPPYSPADLLKLGLYCYLNRVRSSRRQMSECQRNVEVMWLLKKLIPDHRTIARFRSENSKALKNVFRNFTKLCLRLDLYGKELAAIDGSKFEAVNSNDSNFNRQKLADRISRIDRQISDYMQLLETEDAKEETVSEQSAEEIATIISGLQERKAIYEAYDEELTATGELQKSLTDPDSRRMKSNGRSDICYNTQISVDSKHKLIADFAVTNAGNDVNQLSDLAKSTSEVLETYNLSVCADTGYDNATKIAECIMAGITPHVAGTDYDICIPKEEGEVIEEIISHHNGKCVYLKDRNIVVCPMGKTLYPSSYINTEGKASFRNSKACAGCKCRCTTSSRPKDFRFLMPKDKFSKEYNDKSLYLKQVRVKADKAVIHQRKTIVEHPFGTIKRSMDAGYVLTKGIVKVTGEFALTFLAYNLKRVINIFGTKLFIEALLNHSFFFTFNPQHNNQYNFIKTLYLHRFAIRILGQAGSQ